MKIEENKALLEDVKKGAKAGTILAYSTLGPTGPGICGIG